MEHMEQILKKSEYYTKKVLEYYSAIETGKEFKYRLRRLEAYEHRINDIWEIYKQNHPNWELLRNKI